jgi:hypothetical protein
MECIPLNDYAGLPGAEYAALAATVAHERTLAQVFDRIGAAAVEAIVTQDEYTHDVIILLEERRYLVYDST